MLFTLSFSEWQKRTGGTLAAWREQCASLWDAIRTGPHYHGGRPCREVAECNNRAGAAKPS
jgi:hypothetical protein